MLKDTIIEVMFQWETLQKLSPNVDDVVTIIDSKWTYWEAINLTGKNNKLSDWDIRRTRN